MFAQSSQCQLLLLGNEVTVNTQGGHWFPKLRQLMKIHGLAHRSPDPQPSFTLWRRVLFTQVQAGENSSAVLGAKIEARADSSQGHPCGSNH